MRMGTFDYSYLSSSSGIDERDLNGNTFILNMLIPMIALHLRFRVFFDEKSSEQQASSSFGPKCEAADKFFAEFGGVTRQEERVFCDDDHHGDGETASSLGEGFNASSWDSHGDVVKTMGEASTVMCPKRQTLFSSLTLTHLRELWCERRLNTINSRQTKSEAVTSAKTSSLLPENAEEKEDGMRKADEAKTAKGTSTTTAAESTDAASHTTSTVTNSKRSSLFSLLREAVNCLHGDLGRSKAN